MARVLVTGSADGLGLAVGQRLIDQGHEVVLHARSEQRASDTHEAAPGAADVLVGDLADEQQVRDLARAADESGRFDVVVHNAGVGGEAGAQALLAVNVIAPYLLAALMAKPERLIVLSSGSHHGGKADVGPVEGHGSLSYADSKLLDAALSAGIARRWPDVLVNAVDPGWIATRMGGSGAPGDLDQGSATQVWLATSDDPAATVSGRYFKDSREARTEPAVTDAAFQDDLLAALERATGTALPA